jgi:HTH-type transcriptional regulator / antitoxin HipB
MTQERHWYRARSLTALGLAVRGVREATAMTQAQMATRLGTSRATLSRIERGVPASTETVLAALAASGYELVVVPREASIQVSG